MIELNNEHGPLFPYTILGVGMMVYGIIRFIAPILDDIYMIMYYRHSWHYDSIELYLDILGGSAMIMKIITDPSMIITLLLVFHRLHLPNIKNLLFIHTFLLIQCLLLNYVVWRYLFSYYIEIGLEWYAAIYVAVHFILMCVYLLDYAVMQRLCKETTQRDGIPGEKLGKVPFFMMGCQVGWYIWLIIRIYAGIEIEFVYLGDIMLLLIAIGWMLLGYRFLDKSRHPEQHWWEYIEKSKIKLPNSIGVCPHCGNPKMSATEKFCANCGNNFESQGSY